MAGKDNLISLAERTTDEQREISRKGGEASGAARRKKRTMKQAASLILSLKAPSAMSAALEQCGIPEEEQTLMSALVAAQAVKAAEGDTKAARFLRETIGEDPRLKLDAEKLKILKKAQEETSAIVDDWVKSIPDTPATDDPWADMPWI